MFPNDKQLDGWLLDGFENSRIGERWFSWPILLIWAIGILLILDLRDHLREFIDFTNRAERFLKGHRLVLKFEPRETAR